MPVMGVGLDMFKCLMYFNNLDIYGKTVGEEFEHSVRINAAGDVFVSGPSFHQSNKGMCRFYRIINLT